MKLYCVNCGTIITDNYQGEHYSYTHMCREFPFKELKSTTTREEINKIENQCIVLATEHSLLYNSSWYLGSGAFKECKECKTLEEHIEKTKQQYLGKHYREFQPKNPQIAEYKGKTIQLLEDLAEGKLPLG